ncbi:Uncharacterised protein [Serratia quinivorans]|nr:Uncharacterised protein [Serratia quinivorans]
MKLKYSLQPKLQVERKQHYTPDFKFAVVRLAFSNPLSFADVDVPFNRGGFVQ